MDSSNYNDVLRQAQSNEERAKVTMIMNMAEPGTNQSVPDPYYNDDLYDQVFDMLDRACDAIIEQYAKRS